MAKILIADTECNSLDTENGYIQELAYGLYDTDNRRFLNATSELIKWNTPYSVEEGAYEVTGLSRDYCNENGRDASRVFADFTIALGKADYVCGHNFLAFDRPILLSNLARVFFTREHPINATPLIDTILDCPFPKSLKQHSLKYLALDHGYVLTGAHQALNDVYACAHVLSCYDFKQVIQIAATPVITLTKKIDFFDLESRDRLKNMKFYWNPNRKVWEKRIREYWLPEIQLKLNFNLDIS
jgi:DNA polymerase III epsilon subunit-like protein